MAPTRPLAHRRFLHRRFLSLLAAGCAALLLWVILALGCAVRDRSARADAFRSKRATPAQIKEAQRAWRAETRALNAARRQLDADEVVEGRRLLDESLGDELMPLWIGTPWTFGGTARTPFSGSVACGHFMGAVLTGAGLEVDRDIGALASARIVRTFAGPQRTRWWSRRTPAAVVSAVRKEGSGLYLLGLDTHVGMLRVRGRTVDFCHATGRWPRSVVCEPAATSPSLRSDVHVWGPLLTDEVVVAWINGDRIPLAK